MLVTGLLGFVGLRGCVKFAIVLQLFLCAVAADGPQTDPQGLGGSLGRRMQEGPESPPRKCSVGALESL